MKTILKEELFGRDIWVEVSSNCTKEMEPRSIVVSIRNEFGEVTTFTGRREFFWLFNSLHKAYKEVYGDF